MELSAPVPPVVPEWSTPTKAELVGTWKGNASANNIKVVNTIKINADYSGSQLTEGDYSEDPTQLQTVTQMLSELESSGYTTTHNIYSFTGVPAKAVGELRVR